MDYFKLDELQEYSESAGKKYESESTAANWYKDTRNKLGHLVQLLSDSLAIPLEQNYKERPDIQAGRGKGFALKKYVLLGFIPVNTMAGKHLFIKLEFRDFVDSKCKFIIEVDIDEKNNNKASYTQYLGKGSHIEKNRDQLRKDTYWETPVDETFPSDWETLVALILPKVKEDVDYLRTIRKQSLDQVVIDTENPKQNIMSSIDAYSPSLNQILFGPPGTGKTYHTVNKAIAIIENIREADLEKEDRAKLKERFDDYLDSGQIVFCTFHQSMAYEDFIEGIKPQTTGDQKVTYETVPGIFKKICTIAKDNWLDANNGTKEKLSFEDAFYKLREQWEENPNMLFPLRTEGKEFTILGFTKTSIRFKKANGGTDHTLSIATLGDYFYSKRDVRQTGLGIYYPGILKKLKEFQPDIIIEKEEKKYVLIIDEINRGNVSQIFGELITLIEEDKRLGKDEALEVTLPYSDELFGVPPNLYIIGTMNTADRSVEALDTALRRRFSFVEMPPRYDLEELQAEVAGFKLTELLKAINQRIEKLLASDNQIGHSDFLSVKSSNDLQVVFQNKIMPLLQEYFFGDYGKIGLVLGSAFVEKVETNDEKFADFDYEDGSADFAGRTVYRLKNVVKMNDDVFNQALVNLINK